MRIYFFKKLFRFLFENETLIHLTSFFSHPLNLAIEVDGESHCGNEEYDLKRQSEIEKLGIHFLRFDDLEVRHNLDGVVKVIKEWIVANSSLPTPRPSKEGINSLKENKI